MDKRFSSEVPEKLGKYRNGLVLNYAIRESFEEEILHEWKNGGRMEMEGEEPTADFRSQHKYTYYTLNIPMGQWTYGGVINAIISDAYRPDVMEATINNYLLDPTDEDNAKYFSEMQAWRRYAKDIAKQVVKNYQDYERVSTIII